MNAGLFSIFLMDFFHPESPSSVRRFHIGVDWRSVPKEVLALHGVDGSELVPCGCFGSERIRGFNRTILEA